MPSRPLSVLSAISSPSGTEISTIDVAARAEPRGDLFEAGADHLARHGIDGRLARTAAARPGRVTVPTPSPARKLTPEPAAPRAHRRDDQRAMGDVRIVAGVLDDAGRRGETVRQC